MKKTYDHLSHNLYYADQIGTVEDQINFLDSLHFTEPQLYFDFDSCQEVFNCMAHTQSGNSIVSRYVSLYPSMPMSLGDEGMDFRNVTPWPRTFKTSKILDIRAYLESKGYSPKFEIINFAKLCVEDHSVADVDSAVLEDAVLQFPTEELECGN